MGIEVIEAITGLLGAIAWPIATVVIVLLVLRRHREAVNRMIDRIHTFSYPGGQLEMSEIKESQQRVIELQAQAKDEVADPRIRREDVEKLVEEAKRLGRLEAAREGSLTSGRRGIYRNPDNDPRGPWMATDMTSALNRPSLVYPIVSPDGREVLPGNGRSWRYSPKQMEHLVAEQRIYWGNDGKTPVLKRFQGEIVSS
jgi:hypothetical protein